MRVKFFLILSILLLAGCTFSGTYLDSYRSVERSNNNLKGRLLHANIVPIENEALRYAIMQSYKRPYSYRIGPYDTLSITVWNHPELSAGGSTVAQTSNILASNPQQSSGYSIFAPTSSHLNGLFVDTYGDIIFPLIGKIKVGGLSVEQARAKMKSSLTKYIRNPQLSLQVIGFNSQRVNVLGEVMQPGIRSLNDRPLTVLDALSLSGGIKADTADARHIYILRINKDRNISVYWLNAKSPQSLVVAEYFRLANNDIIYVSPAGVVSWNRVMSQILPTVQTIWQTANLLDNW